MENSIKNNLFLINKKIENACKLYSQEPSRVNLIAVSKTMTSDKIIEAIKLGCKTFGENYIQEAKEKWVKIKEEFPQIKLHFIGHLQSNKAHEAVDLFDAIETLDSKKLALELKKEVVKQNKNPQIFIQVNIGEEPQKGGLELNELEDFIKFVRDECGLNLVGLMCIPPEAENPAPYFALLNKLAKKHNLMKLSMGMSADFETAIALGSTHIRVGSAIFGKR
jgi:pyridoxal phosphate enzyme (YggS family)